MLNRIIDIIDIIEQKFFEFLFFKKKFFNITQKIKNMSAQILVSFSPNHSQVIFINPVNIYKIQSGALHYIVPKGTKDFATALKGLLQQKKDPAKCLFGSADEHIKTLSFVKKLVENKKAEGELGFSWAWRMA